MDRAGGYVRTVGIIATVAACALMSCGCSAFGLPRTGPFSGAYADKVEAMQSAPSLGQRTAATLISAAELTAYGAAAYGAYRAVEDDGDSSDTPTLQINNESGNVSVNIGAGSASTTASSSE